MSKYVQAFLLIVSIILVVNYGGGFVLSKLFNLDFNICTLLVAVVNLGFILFTSYLTKVVNFILK